MKLDANILEVNKELDEALLRYALGISDKKEQEEIGVLIQNNSRIRSLARFFKEEAMAGNLKTPQEYLQKEKEELEDVYNRLAKAGHFKKSNGAKS